LEGYLIALKNLDEIISLIRSSPDVDTARSRLMKRYKLSELQANAILEMQLRRLAALERKKIETEYKETIDLIKDLEGLLKSPRKMRGVASDELLKVKAAYGDRRRTQIVSMKGRKAKKAPLTAAELVREQVLWIGMTADGMIARTRDDKPPRLSGSDAPKLLVKANATDTLYLVSARGLAAAVAVHTLPDAEKLADGNPFNKQSPLQVDEMPVAALALPARKSDLPEETCLLTVTRGGMLKKSAISELPGPSAQTFKLANVNDGDRLGWAVLTDGHKEILLATAQGMTIRFSEEEVRPMGLAAAGVNGIKLGVGDEVIGVQILPVEGELFLVASDGKAKRVEQKDFPSQGRYGKGVIGWELPPRVTLVGLAAGRKNDIVTLHLAKAAPKMSRLDAAPLRKRSAVRGEAVAEVKPGDIVEGLVEGWALERFVAVGKVMETSKKKAAPKKMAAVSETKPAAVGKVTQNKPAEASKKKPAPARKVAPKGKLAANKKKPAPARKAAPEQKAVASKKKPVPTRKVAPKEKPAAGKKKTAPGKKLAVKKKTGK
jgi:DNA gyrase subunit A